MPKRRRRVRFSGSKPRADETAVLIEVPVNEVMYALYGPVSAVHCQQMLR